MAVRLASSLLLVGGLLALHALLCECTLTSAVRHLQRVLHLCQQLQQVELQAVLRARLLQATPSRTRQ